MRVHLRRRPHSCCLDVLAQTISHAATDPTPVAHAQAVDITLHEAHRSRCEGLFVTIVGTCLQSAVSNLPELMFTAISLRSRYDYASGLDDGAHRTHLGTARGRLWTGRALLRSCRRNGPAVMLHRQHKARRSRSRELSTSRENRSSLWRSRLCTCDNIFRGREWGMYVGRI